MRTFTEKRFFKWEEDDVSVTLRNRSGSYGGGSEVFCIGNGQLHQLYLQEKVGALNCMDDQQKVLNVDEAYCIGNGQVDQLYLQDKVGALNCMHDQQATLIERERERAA